MRYWTALMLLWGFGLIVALTAGAIAVGAPPAPPRASARLQAAGR